MYSFNIVNNSLCLSAEALANSMGIALESALNTVKKGLQAYRNGSYYYQHFDDPGDARKKWIVYDTLPEVALLRVNYFYGDIWAAYYEERLTEAARGKELQEDVSYFLNAKVKKGGLGFSLKEASDLAAACGWLRLLEDENWRDRFETQREFLKRCTAVIKQRNYYGFKVGNPRVLARKLKAWKTKGRDALISARFGNRNSLKITELGKKRLLQLYASALKPTFFDTAKIYNSEATERGWDKLTEERVRQVLMEPQNQQIWFAARHGVEAMRNRMERTIKRRKPSFPDSLWSLDGFTIQLRYVDQSETVLSGLYGVAVLDVNSDYVIGYALGGSETATLVQAALRAACRKRMTLPHQLQYDNSSANKSKEVQQLINRLSKVNFPCAPYNGKSKPVENWIGRMEQRIMRHFKNFKGGNITSPSLQSKANPDLLARQIKEGSLPTKEQVIAQFELIVEVHNSSVGRDGKTPTERYGIQHPKRRTMDYLSMVEAFWVERRKEVRYTKDGLTIEVDKQRYTYEVQSERGVEDREFRRTHLGDRFKVRYDPDDLEYINLYSGDT